MGFDAKKFGGCKAQSKKVETIEDALFVIGCSDKCGSVCCSECGIRLYARDGDCDSARDSAREFMMEQAFEGYRNELTGLRGIDAQSKLYEIIFERGGCKPQVEPEKSCARTCAECLHSRMHSSGILWCDSFHNFVHEDGYCYRFATEVDADV